MTTIDEISCGQMDSVMTVYCHTCKYQKVANIYGAVRILHTHEEQNPRHKIRIY